MNSVVLEVTLPWCVTSRRNGEGPAALAGSVRRPYRYRRSRRSRHPAPHLHDDGVVASTRCRSQSGRSGPDDDINAIEVAWSPVLTLSTQPEFPGGGRRRQRFEVGTECPPTPRGPNSRRIARPRRCDRVTMCEDRESGGGHRQPEAAAQRRGRRSKPEPLETRPPVSTSSAAPCGNLRNAESPCPTSRNVTWSRPRRRMPQVSGLGQHPDGSPGRRSQRNGRARTNQRTTKRPVVNRDAWPAGCATLNVAAAQTDEFG